VLELQKQNHLLVLQHYNQKEGDHPGQQGNHHQLQNKNHQEAVHSFWKDASKDIS